MINPNNLYRYINQEVLFWHNYHDPYGEIYLIKSVDRIDNSFMVNGEIKQTIKLCDSENTTWTFIEPYSDYIITQDKRIINKYKLELL